MCLSRRIKSEAYYLVIVAVITTNCHVYVDFFLPSVAYQLLYRYIVMEVHVGFL